MLFFSLIWFYFDSIAYSKERRTFKKSGTALYSVVDSILVFLSVPGFRHLLILLLTLNIYVGQKHLTDDYLFNHCLVTALEMTFIVNPV